VSEKKPEYTGGNGVGSMIEMEKHAMKNTCTAMESKLADLLLDPGAASSRVQAHVAGCAFCRRELANLRATMALLDTWEGPQPSPYFLTRLDAQMREERAAAPANWLTHLIDRLRARAAYGPSMHVRPLAAMALSVVLLLGGGAYLGVINDWDQSAASPGQAVVHDLQTLDNNAQLLDQLEALSNNNDNGD
jgi:anti-sigma factor RsiW